MRKFINAFIAAALMSAFSMPAYAEGVDHVSTDGAICGERSAGKSIDSESSTAKQEGNEATSN